MYGKQGSCQSDHAAHLGAIHGDGGRDPPDAGDERSLPPTKANDRAAVWNSEGESRVPIYTAVWKRPDGNESRVDIRMHESEKTGKDTEEEGASSGRFNVVPSKNAFVDLKSKDKKTSRAKPCGLNTTLSSV